MSVTKLCRACGQEKPLDEFYKRKDTRSGIRPYCIPCTYSRKNKWRKDNQERVTAGAKDLRRGNKQQAIEYKGGKCMKCGGSFHLVAFDFHHRDPTEKDTEPNRLLSGSWEKAKAELDKCDLLCANCHRITHEELRNGLAL